ncbi:MAG: hypothetical protein ACP5IL_17365 [Syntrophobacteraceae bacterium]
MIWPDWQFPTSRLAKLQADSTAKLLDSNPSLQIARKNNFPAIRLYDRLGFKNRGECTLFIQERLVEFFKMEIDKQEFSVHRQKESNNE